MNSTALAVLRAEPHLSVSSITTYLKCPEQLWHCINRSQRNFRPAVLSFGSAIHVALAMYYRRLMDGQSAPTTDDLATSFSDAWTRELTLPLPVLFDKDDCADSVRDKGVAMLGAFSEDAPRPHRVVGVEEAFSIELVDPSTGNPLAERLVGVFDAIVKLPGGTFEILEHKTAARRFTESRLRYDLQATAYSLAAPAVGLGVDPAVTFQVLLKTKHPGFERYTVSRTKQDRHDFLRTAAAVATATRQGIFFPRRDWWCSTCPYAGPCLAG